MLEKLNSAFRDICCLCCDNEIRNMYFLHSLHSLKTISISNLIKVIPKRRFHFTSNIKTNTSLAEINTSPIKDVILFKYENPRFFKVLNLFAVVQFGFWSYLSLTAYETLRDAPVPKNAEKWWEKFNLGENKYRYTIAFSCFLIGSLNFCYYLFWRK